MYYHLQVYDVYAIHVGYEWMPGILAFLLDVEPHEVVQALDNPHRWPRQVRGPHGIPYIAIHSRTTTGRPVTIVVRHLGGHDSMIVGARSMTPTDIALFEQWEHDNA
jgi:hypothetical protein